MGGKGRLVNRSLLHFMAGALCPPISLLLQIGTAPTHQAAILLAFWFRIGIGLSFHKCTTNDTEVHKSKFSNNCANQCQLRANLELKETILGPYQPLLPLEHLAVLINTTDNDPQDSLFISTAKRCSYNQCLQRFPSHPNPYHL